MDNLVGIHQLFASTPIWFTAVILWVFTDGAIHLMRDKLEGLGYQTAFSAKFGDAGLIGAILIGATILQRGDSYLPTWLMFIKNGYFQILILAIGFGFGIGK